MNRLTDPSKCRKITDKYPRYFTFDVEEWFANPNNYAVIDGDNIAFGEYKNRECIGCTSVLTQLGVEKLFNSQRKCLKSSVVTAPSKLP